MNRRSIQKILSLALMLALLFTLPTGAALRAEGDVGEYAGGSPPDALPGDATIALSGETQPPDDDAEPTPSPSPTPSPVPIPAQSGISANAAIGTTAQDAFAQPNAVGADASLLQNAEAGGDPNNIQQLDVPVSGYAIAGHEVPLGLDAGVAIEEANLLVGITVVDIDNNETKTAIWVENFDSLNLSSPDVGDYVITISATDPTGDGNILTATRQVNVTLPVRMYTVTFDAGDSNVSSLQVVAGGLIVRPDDPSKANHTFGGWHWSNAFSSPWDFGSDVVTEDITLYAKWLPNVCTVVYNANGGTGEDVTVVVPYASVYTTLFAEEARFSPPSSNYIFGGWNRTPDGSGGWIGGGMELNGLIADVTLYAVWTWNGPNIIYYANGGVGGLEIPITESTTHTVLSKEEAGISKYGYTFLGWGRTSASTEVSFLPGNEVDVTGGMVFYALWAYDDASLCTLTYDANGGLGGTTQTGIKPGSLVTVLSDTAAGVSWPGHTFLGWDTYSYADVGWYGPNQINFSPSFQVDEENAVLYAIWEYDNNTTITITYDPGNGSGTATSVDVIPGEYTPVKDPGELFFARDNHHFFGWTTTGGFSFPSYHPLGIPGDQWYRDTTLYAVWSWNITYNANGGFGSRPGFHVLAGTDITVLDADSLGITRAGHTFTGWNTQPDGSGKAYAAEDLAQDDNGNITLYAQWKWDGQTRVTITYHSNWGSATKAYAVNAGTQHTTLDQTTAEAEGVSRYGYNLLGWSKTRTGGVDVGTGTSITVDENLNLYAFWQYDRRTRVTLAYKANGGIGGRDKKDMFPGTQQTVVSPGDIGISRSSYTFRGWSTAADGDIKYDGGEKITVDVDTTLYAIWDNTIAYDANGGSGAVADPSSPYTSGKQVTVLSNGFTPPDGKVFGSWNTRADGSGTRYAPGVPFAITEHTTLYAIWANTVTYDANGGTGVTADPLSPYADGARVTVLPNRFSAPSGKAFVSWNTKPDGTGTRYAPGDTFAITANTILYAIWASNGTPTPTIHIVYAEAAKGGAIWPSGWIGVGEGESLTFTVSANAGYVIADVQVDGVSVGQGREYTLKDIRAGHTVTATFKETGITFIAPDENDVPLSGPSAPEAPEPEVTILTGEGETASITMRQTGLSSFDITADTVEQMIRAALEALARLSRTGEDFDIHFAFDADENLVPLPLSADDKLAEDLTARMDAAALTRLANAPIRGVEIRLGGFRVGLDKDALWSLFFESEGKDVIFTAEPVNSLTGALGVAVEGRPAFDMRIRYEDDGALVSITDLRKGQMTGGIHYYPGEDENTDTLAVLVINESWQVEPVPGSHYHNGWVVWAASDVTLFGVGHVPGTP